MRYNIGYNYYNRNRLAYRRGLHSSAELTLKVMGALTALGYVGMSVAEIHQCILALEEGVINLEDIYAPIKWEELSVDFTLSSFIFGQLLMDGVVGSSLMAYLYLSSDNIGKLGVNRYGESKAIILGSTAAVAYVTSFVVRLVVLEESLDVSVNMLAAIGLGLLPVLTVVACDYIMAAVRNCERDAYQATVASNATDSANVRARQAASLGREQEMYNQARERLLALRAEVQAQAKAEKNKSVTGGYEYEVITPEGDKAVASTTFEEQKEIEAQIARDLAAKAQAEREAAEVEIASRYVNAPGYTGGNEDLDAHIARNIANNVGGNMPTAAPQYVYVQPTESDKVQGVIVLCHLVRSITNGDVNAPSAPYVGQ